jgi:uncharacterized protein
LSRKKDWFIFETGRRNNRYFYDQKNKRIQLCHPVLYHFLQMEINGIDIPGWIDSLEIYPIKIDHIGVFPREEIEYYYKKYSLLKENGYFNTVDREERFSGELVADDIKHTLANLRQVTFEITDRCNLACEYCGYGKFYEDYDTRTGKNMDTRTAIRIIDYLAEYWNSSFNQSHNRTVFISFYGGEPLLNVNFIKQVIEYVNGLITPNNRFAFSMTTNGLLIEKHMDFLVENDFGLLISLDGNEMNNGYRVLKNGRPAFKTIIENIDALKNKYPEFFQNKVYFNAVLHNKNSVSSVYNFIKERYNKTPFISPLNNSGIKESMKEEFDKTYRNFRESLYDGDDYLQIEQDMFASLPNVRQIMEFLFEGSNFYFDDYTGLIEPGNDVKRIPTGTCLPFFKKLFLTVNGKILPCERIGQLFPLGMASPDGIDLDLERVTEIYNNFYRQVREQCAVCSKAEMCKQCIYNMEISPDGHIKCKSFVTRKNYSDYLASLVSSLEEKPGMFSKIIDEVRVE